MPQLIPVKYNSNADTMKLDILIENRGKYGIYRWVHNDSARSYIGSAVNLSIRLRKYYTFSQLIINKMIINRAHLKYRYSNFSLHILENCDKSILLEREQYYLDSR